MNFIAYISALLIIVTILSCFFLRKKNINMKILLIIFVTIIVIQNTYIFINAFGKKEETQRILEYSEIMEILTSKYKDFELTLVNEFVESDIKYSDIDGDDDIEIIISKPYTHPSKFIVLDYEGDSKYNIVIDTNDIMTYHKSNGSNFIILNTQTVGKGTGVAGSMYEVYRIENNQYDLVWTGEKESVWSKNGAEESLLSSTIDISDNKLEYLYYITREDDNGNIIKTTDYKEIYLLRNGKFTLSKE